MAEKKVVRVDDEEVEKELMERFDRAIENIEENELRHTIPLFLKTGIDPVREYRKFRREVADSVSLLGSRNKKKKARALKS